MEDREELLSITDRFKQSELCIVGDLILDEYVWGTVDRISPEAPVVVVKVKEKTYRLGGAANVAHNLISLGAKARVIGVVGEDRSGGQVIDGLRQVGVGVDGILSDPASQTNLKTRVVAHSQQVVRIDRESVDEKQDKSAKVWPKLKTQLAECSGLIVSDYAKGVIGQSLLKEIEECSLVGARTDHRVPVLIDPKNINFDYYSSATVVTPNRSEAEQASGVRIIDKNDAINAGDVLRDKWKSKSVLVTLGEMGMVLSQESGHEHISTVAREVYDVSGAGDTVSATYLLSLSVGATPKQAAVIANQAAGIVVREIGTAVVTIEKLKEEIKKGP